MAVISPSAPRVSTTVRVDRENSTDRTDASRVLALVAPLLLFAHGILGWVDGLDGTRGTGPLGVAAAVALVGSVAAWCWLAVALGERMPPTGRGLLVAAAVVTAAFGSGATGAVAVGRAAGLLGDDAPGALLTGGPLLLAAGLGVILTLAGRAGRMPLGSLALAALAGLVLAVPLDLLPLGALLLLIAVGPLTREPEPVTADDDLTAA